MDEAERMDLALNSDFDSTLLNCLEEDAETLNETSSTQSVTDKAASWDATDPTNRLGILPSFIMDDPSEYQKYIAALPPLKGAPTTADSPLGRGAMLGSLPPSVPEASVETAVAMETAVVSTDGSVSSSSKSPKAASLVAARDSSKSASSLSQELPSKSTTQSTVGGTTASVAPPQVPVAQLHSLLLQPSANCPPQFAPAGTAADVAASQLSAAAALFPLAFNAQAAGVPFPNPFLFQLPTDVPPVNLPSSLPVAPPVPSAPASKPPAAASVRAKSPTASQQSNLPPFLLFDAPVELRANFIQSQRAHGIPVVEDNNSVHYGMTVNGFHPQDNNGDKLYNNNVKLVDARHGDKRAKNAKEKKRAQRITDLIDQLRDKMEKGGWKVTMKSKFHTLSSCAEYLKHLAKVNKEKEKAVKKARSDLEAKRRKLEEDKAQQDPSDPESTTSSLTASSGSAGAAKGRGGGLGPKNAEAESGSADTGKRDASSDSGGDEAGKKPRLASLESSVSSSTSSGGDDSGNQTPGHQVLSLDQTVSSVSDITDSNNGSSTNSGSEDSQSRSSRRRLNSTMESDSCTGTSSVSSDAAVARGGANDTKHSDVVFQGRKRKAHPMEEVTSLDASFELDYEEVFVKSNVPQLLATTQGKIVAWNEFFLKVTGFSPSEVEPLTIFSLVQSSKLSNLFEIFAAALRHSPKKARSGVMKQQWNYSAITLPCVNFPSGSQSNEKPEIPLYITVTLMADEDPRKRCFHCLFTDCPGTNGKLGTITPELLTTLFTSHSENQDGTKAAAENKPASEDQDGTKACPENKPASGTKI